MKKSEFNAEVKRLRESYVTHARWRNVNDAEVCAACRAASEQVYPLNDLPFLPHQCTNPDGCRCYFTPAHLDSQEQSASERQPTNSVQVKLTTAKDMINARQYDAATALLRTIDHPKAREWLAKLDARKPKQPAKPKRSRKWIGVSIVLAVVVIAVAIAIGLQVQRQALASQASASLTAYCIANVYGDLVRCNSWVQSRIETYGDTIYACLSRHNTQIERPQFLGCLRQAGIPLG